MEQSIIADGSKRKLGLDPVVAMSLAGALLFFLISGAVAYFNLRTLRDNNQKIVHSQRKSSFRSTNCFLARKMPKRGSVDFYLRITKNIWHLTILALLAIPPRLDS